jgi:DNA-binding CsgD family transcriptional regulator
MRTNIVLVGLPTPTYVVRVVPADGAIILGRSSHCDLVFDHPSVSRRHARVRRSGDAGIHVMDLGSRNGTFVDGARVSGAVVPCGRQVRFGGVMLLVCEEGRALGDVDSETGTDDAQDGRRQEAGVAGLTEAQREVFGLLIQGLAEKAIAKWLGVSVHTAHNHVCAIYKALRVHSRAELMAIVLREEQTHGKRAAFSADLGQCTRARPKGERGAGLKLYYLSPQDREAYACLLDGHGIAYSDLDGSIRIDAPVTPVVMRVLSAALLKGCPGL